MEWSIWDIIAKVIYGEKSSDPNMEPWGTLLATERNEEEEYLSGCCLPL